MFKSFTGFHEAVVMKSLTDVRVLDKSSLELVKVQAVASFGFRKHGWASSAGWCCKAGASFGVRKAKAISNISQLQTEMVS
eukprot:666272-Heterocapsa_arctica.AAC.1